MSRSELERVEVMGRVGRKELKLTDAAVILELSYRQVKRLWGRYRRKGRKGLQHGNVGRSSNRSKPAGFRRRVLSLIKQKYSGTQEERFGPTLAAEHLAEEDGIRIDHETLRGWMLAEGLWSRKRKRKKHFQRRERKEHFGELVQLDGSFHDWLEDRGPGGCLMTMVDDATSTTLARLGQEETTWAAAGVLRAWIEKHGVPCALYTDWKNVYIRPATPAEQLRGEVPVTQFGRMCKKMGIAILAASSPQAKGRVERNHGTHQDRLIKKMRRKGIASHEGANEYLEKEYLPAHNRRFARQPAKPEDYHGRKLTARELHQIFYVEDERTIGNDWVIRYGGRYLQLQPGNRRYGPTKSKALVCKWEEGSVEVYYRGERIAFKELSQPKPRALQISAPRARAQVARKAKQDHPWRRTYQNTKPWVSATAPVRPLVETRASASP